MGLQIHYNARLLKELARATAKVDGQRASISLPDLATAAGVGETQCAVMMKGAVAQGWAWISSPKGAQYRWIATEALDAALAKEELPALYDSESATTIGGRVKDRDEAREAAGVAGEIGTARKELREREEREAREQLEAESRLELPPGEGEGEGNGDGGLEH